MQSTTPPTVRCSVHPPQLLFYKKGGRLSAHFHLYLCGRIAAEWLIYMICYRIKELRENAGFSQSQLAKKLDISRSAVNAWEMGLSTPTTQYIVAMAKLFHVSSDYLLGLESCYSLRIENYTEDELSLVYGLIKYIDARRG